MNLPDLIWRRWMKSVIFSLFIPLRSHPCQQCPSHFAGADENERTAERYICMLRPLFQAGSRAAERLLAVFAGPDDELEGGEIAFAGLDCRVGSTSRIGHRWYRRHLKKSGCCGTRWCRPGATGRNARNEACSLSNVTSRATSSRRLPGTRPLGASRRYAGSRNRRAN